MGMQSSSIQADQRAVTRARQISHLGPKKQAFYHTTLKVQSHRDITTPDISTNTIYPHFFWEPSHMHCKVPGYNHCHTAYNLSPEPCFCDYIWGERMKRLDNSPKDEHMSVSAVFVALNGSDIDELLPKVALAEARHHTKMLAAFVQLKDWSCSATKTSLLRFSSATLLSSSSHRSPHSSHRGSDRHQYAPKQLNM